MNIAYSRPALKCSFEHPQSIFSVKNTGLISSSYSKNKRYEQSFNGLEIKKIVKNPTVRKKFSQFSIISAVLGFIGSVYVTLGLHNECRVARSKFENTIEDIFSLQTRIYTSNKKHNYITAGNNDGFIILKDRYNKPLCMSTILMTEYQIEAAAIISDNINSFKDFIKSISKAKEEKIVLKHLDKFSVLCRLNIPHSEKKRLAQNITNLIKKHRKTQSSLDDKKNSKHGWLAFMVLRLILTSILTVKMRASGIDLHKDYSDLISDDNTMVIDVITGLVSNTVHNT